MNERDRERENERERERRYRKLREERERERITENFFVKAKSQPKAGRFRNEIVPPHTTVQYMSLLKVMSPIVERHCAGVSEIF